MYLYGTFSMGPGLVTLHQIIIIHQVPADDNRGEPEIGDSTYLFTLVCLGHGHIFTDGSSHVFFFSSFFFFIIHWIHIIYSDRFLFSSYRYNK